MSCANYEAREFGIQAGMFISEAKRLCPDIIVVPYLFSQYQEISEKVYRILLQYTCYVQPLSCDEALLDVTGLGDPEQIAKKLREEILSATGCTASSGESDAAVLSAPCDGISTLSTFPLPRNDVPFSSHKVLDPQYL